MDYTFTQEQKMIADSVGRLLKSDYDFQKRCHWLDNNQRFQPGIWKKFAELGLLAMPFEASYGGLDASIQDMSVIVGEMGKSLVLEPFSFCYLGSLYLSRYATSEQKQRYFPDIVSGEKRVVVCMPPACHGFFLNQQPETKAQKNKDQTWTLSGSQPMVYGADSATDVIVFAKDDQDSIRAFMVSIEQIQCQKLSMIDDTGVANCRLKDVKVSQECMLGFDAQSLACLQVAIICLLSSEAVAIMQTVNEKTKQYLMNREQFSQPLSKFQLLQHRLVEMYVQEEQARSLSMTLSMEVRDSKSASDVLYLAYLTKLKMNDYCQYVGEQSVQLHGGMGVSDEMDIAHYFRRLTCIRHQFGDQTYCLSKCLSFF